MQNAGGRLWEFRTLLRVDGLPRCRGRPSAFTRKYFFVLVLVNRTVRKAGLITRPVHVFPGLQVSRFDVSLYKGGQFISWCFLRDFWQRTFRCDRGYGNVSPSVENSVCVAVALFPWGLGAAFRNFVVASKRGTVEEVFLFIVALVLFCGFGYCEWWFRSMYCTYFCAISRRPYTAVEVYVSVLVDGYFRVYRNRTYRTRRG